MRSVRSLTSGLALVALLPAVGSAQAGRNFKDAWFWGVKFGTMSFSTATDKNVMAPMVGGEWLITRTRGALYISAEQAFFNRMSAVSVGSGLAAPVGIHNLQRVTAAVLAFPAVIERKNGTSLRPYGGLGVALNFIGSASVADTVAANYPGITSTIHDQNSGAALLAMAGLQAQYRRFSLFGQTTLMPTKDFLFNNRATYTLEGGIRINVGTSIDRP